MQSDYNTFVWYTTQMISFTLDLRLEALPPQYSKENNVRDLQAPKCRKH